MEEPKIFIINTIIYSNDPIKEKIIFRGPYTKFEIKPHIDIIIKDYKIVDPRLFNIQIICPHRDESGELSGVHVDVTSGNIIQIINQSANEYNESSAESKYKYDTRYDVERAMTESEIADWEKQNIQTFDEWIQKIQETSILPTNINTYTLHAETLLEWIGYWITIEFGYYISNEFDDIDIPVSTSNKYKAFDKYFYGEQKPTNTVYEDIYTTIKKTQNLEYLLLYRNYHLLKCLCFVLHDKPVDEFAPKLYEFIYPRCQKEYLLKIGRNLEPNDATKPINQLWEIWRNGFNISQGAPKVTQTRCHNTIDSLTVKFDEIMKSVRIHVPQKMVVFSTPYSFFKEGMPKIINELESILNNYSNGLGDAVGNKTYIEDFKKIPIYPKTCSEQDAAPTTLTDKSLIVIEDTNVNTDKTIVHTYKINENEFEIEPIRFGDIAIYCKQFSGKSVFLYYAAVDCFTDAAKSQINESYFETSFTTIPPILFYVKDDGMDKILFAAVFDKISQNDTIPLIANIVPTMINSARNGNVKNYIRTDKMMWLKGNTVLENEVLILLATYAKEMGDQSKIRVVENISSAFDIIKNRGGSKLSKKQNKNVQRGGRIENNSYVATVDSFFSESMNNGGVLFKGGNIIFTEQEGFHSLSEEYFTGLLNVMYAATNYTHTKIIQKLSIFCENLIAIIKNIIEKVALPFPIYLTYVSIMVQLQNPQSLLASDSEYNALISKFDRNKQSGIFDNQSFLRRILNLDSINNIFAQYELHTNEPFYLQLTTNGPKRYDLQTMITDYLIVGYEIKPLIETTPLYFLIEQIPTLKVFSYRLVADKRTPLFTFDPLIVIAEVFLEKMKTYITTYASGLNVNAEDILIILFACNKNINYEHPEITSLFGSTPALNNILDRIKHIQSQSNSPNYKYEIGADQLIKNYITLFTSNGPTEPIAVDEPKYNDLESQEDDILPIEQNQTIIAENNQLEQDLNDIEKESGLKHADSDAMKVGGTNKIPFVKVNNRKIYYKTIHNTFVYLFNYPIGLTRHNIDEYSQFLLDISRLKQNDKKSKKNHQKSNKNIKQKNPQKYKRKTRKNRI